jgi:acetyl-CoA carboxylase biotin carboxyl carrier protein
MAFKMDEIRELIRLIDESQIEEFEIDNEGAKVVIRKALAGKMTASTAYTPTGVPATVPLMSPSTVPVSSEAPIVAKTRVKENLSEEKNLHQIVSPMVGTFYRAPSPDSRPYVEEGDKVDDKSVVCIVEAMKLMNEIEAEIQGTILKILVKNGQLVEYGQALFLVRTD